MQAFLSVFLLYIRKSAVGAAQVIPEIQSHGRSCWCIGGLSAMESVLPAQYFCKSLNALLGFSILKPLLYKLGIAFTADEEINGLDCNCKTHV